MTRTTIIVALFFSIALLVDGIAAKDRSEPTAKNLELDDVPLIPRRALLGDPVRSSPTVSPDGTKLAFLAVVDGRPTLHVGPIGDVAAAKSFPMKDHFGVMSYQWAYDSKHILVVEQLDRARHTRIVVVSVDTGNLTNLTQSVQMRLKIEGISRKVPGDFLISGTGSGSRVSSSFGLYRFSYLTSDYSDLCEQTQFFDFGVDAELNVRYGMEVDSEGGGYLLSKPDEQLRSWTPGLRILGEIGVRSEILGLDRTGTAVIMIDGRQREHAALVVSQLTGKGTEVVFADPRADVSDALIHPLKRTIEAVAVTRVRKTWHVRDSSLAHDFDFLTDGVDGDLSILSRSEDGNHWIVSYDMPTGLVHYYDYDRRSSTRRFLFSDREDLRDSKLSPKHVRTIKARDGLDLICYLTLPPWEDERSVGKPDSPLPMILSVHSGPWMRDVRGYDPLHLLLANRGYAVLSVNFRGSSGLGRKFMDAGDGAWGGKMQDDLIDAVDWAIKEGIADPARVGIIGSTYGGYAVLMGLVSTPKKFACGVDLSGPANLVQYVETALRFGGVMATAVRKRVGNNRSPEGRKQLESESPITSIRQIKKPLLIGHGSRDPAVLQPTSERIAEVLLKRHVPATLILFPNEGHGIGRSANIEAFLAVTEAFLAKHLGGRAEPIGDAFGRSSITAPIGADEIPGLTDALGKRKKAARAKRK